MRDPDSDDTELDDAPSADEVPSILRELVRAPDREPGPSRDGRLPRRRGPYEIRGLLGRGGNGVVYHAFDTRLARDVALKMTRFVSADRESSARTWREARAVAALRHPRIVSVYSVDEIDGELAIVMELVCGETLRARIARGLDAPAAVRIALELLDAVAAAHRAGIVHRDLKPTNVRIDQEGHVKLLDFGIASFDPALAARDLVVSVAVPQVETRPGTVVGTPAYMAPEQRLGQPATRRSDVYALGLVLYEIFTGQRLARAEMTRAPVIGEAEARALRAAVPREGGAWAAILATALSAQPDDRWESAEAMQSALRARLRLAALRRRARLGGVALAVLAAIGAGFFVRDAPTPRSSSAPAAALAGPTSQPLTQHGPDNRVVDVALAPDGLHVAYADELGALRLLRPETDRAEAPGAPSTLEIPGRACGVAWGGPRRLLVAAGASCRAGPRALLELVLSSPVAEPRELEPRVREIAGAPDGSGHAWVVDGRLLVAQAGARRVLAHDDPALGRLAGPLAFSPDARWIAYVREVPGSQSTRIVAQRTGGGAEVTLLDRPDLLLADAERGFAWTWPGLAIARQAVGAGGAGAALIELVRVDLTSAEVLGAPVRLARVPGVTLSRISASLDLERVAALRSVVEYHSVVAELGEGGLRDVRRVALSTQSRVSSFETDERLWLMIPAGGAHVLATVDVPTDTAAEPGDPEIVPLTTSEGTTTSYAVAAPGAAGVLAWRVAPQDGAAAAELVHVERAQVRSLLRTSTEAIAPLGVAPLWAHLRCARAGARCLLGQHEQGAFVVRELEWPSGTLGPEVMRTGSAVDDARCWDVSPDGARLARCAPSEGGGRALEVDGHGTVALPGPCPDALRVEWHPRGDALAVVLNRGCARAQRELWSVPLDGGEPMLLAGGPGERPLYTAIAPSGARIAVSSLALDGDAWWMRLPPALWLDDAPR